LTSCSKPIKIFKFDNENQHIILKLYSDSTFIEKVDEIDDTYKYSGIWSGNLTENSIFRTTATKRGFQIITLTPIKEYKIINGKAKIISNNRENSKYKTIENQNLKSAFILNSSPTFKGYFYNGSDEKFHYFISKWKIQKDIYFKLHIEDLEITRPFDFEQKELRIDLLNLDNNIEFGKNEYYKLYIID
jgi:hypothetical protein